MAFVPETGNPYLFTVGGSVSQGSSPRDGGWEIR